MKRLRGKFTDEEVIERISSYRKARRCHPAVWALLTAVLLAFSGCGNSGEEAPDTAKTAQEEQVAALETGQSGSPESGALPGEEQSGSRESGGLPGQGQSGLRESGPAPEEEQGVQPQERQTREPESRQSQGPGQSGYAIKEQELDKIIGSYETEPVFEVPEYSGAAYIAVNDNNPFFTKSNLPRESFEYYSDLDALGRCGVVCANVGQDIMPTEERGDIGQVKPTGWHTVKYDTVDGKYLYNRCHLIGYQLSAENANEKNLITGTRYLNVTGMLPFENMVADYVKETGNHVLYRVSPIFEGDDLLACGVLMEGWSVEDNGEGVCFNVFAYNVQPGIVIDYANGESYAQDGAATAGEESEQALQEGNGGQETASAVREYILNTNSMKFHYPDCRSVKQMAEKNKQPYTGSREDIIAMGYTPCGNCNP